MPRTGSSLPKVNNKSRADSKPANWPQHLRYMNRSCFHSSVSPSTRQYLTGSSSVENKGPALIIKGPKIAIRAITDSVHPACGQFGLYAVQRIPSKAWIIEYVGQIHCDERPESDYDLSLYRFPDGLSVGIDASIMGNEARFVNDYRGVSKKANAIFVDERNQSGELKMNIRSTEEIKKGEEILVSYGKSWWRNRSDALDQDGASQSLK